MRKTRIETKSREISEFFCDVCGKNTGGKYKCQICKRDLCFTDTEIHYISSAFDYPEYYCQQCWDIGEHFRAEQDKIEDEADNKIDKLQEQWIKKAKEKIDENKIIKEST